MDLRARLNPRTTDSLVAVVLFGLALFNLTDADVVAGIYSRGPGWVTVVLGTRELGLLRAIGMTRRQVRRMVRGEAVIVALFGTILGLVAGTDLGWVTVMAMADQGLGVFGIPWVQLASLLLLAVAAGMVAAIGPARSASRMNVLAALSTE